MLLISLESLDKSSWGVFSEFFTFLLFILVVILHYLGMAKLSKGKNSKKDKKLTFLATIVDYDCFTAKMNSKTVKFTEKTPQLDLSKLSKGVSKELGMAGSPTVRTPSPQRGPWL